MSPHTRHLCSLQPTDRPWSATSLQVLISRTIRPVVSEISSTPSPSSCPDVRWRPVGAQGGSLGAYKASCRGTRGRLKITSTSNVAPSLRGRMSQVPGVSPATQQRRLRIHSLETSLPLPAHKVCLFRRAQSSSGGRDPPSWCCLPPHSLAHRAYGVNGDEVTTYTLMDTP